MTLLGRDEHGELVGRACDSSGHTVVLAQACPDFRSHVAVAASVATVGRMEQDGVAGSVSQVVEHGLRIADFTTEQCGLG